MNYFRLENSLGQDIGVYPQSINDPVTIKSPGHLSTFLNKRLDATVHLPTPTLRSKAIPTDLLSVICTAIDLVMSEKLRDLFLADLHNQFDVKEINFYWKKELLSYWLIHPYHYKLSVIDFNNSEFCRVGVGQTEMQPEYPKDGDELMTLWKSMPHGEGPFIKKLTLLNTGATHFFALPFVNGGIGYYVSSERKQEIEDVGCTGITFQEA